jgi:hypothetical protein
MLCVAPINVPRTVKPHQHRQEPQKQCQVLQCRKWEHNNHQQHHSKQDNQILVNYSHNSEGK